MKNLTIKKIALGVFLAGYAASSAFALTATTTNTIKGHAPFINAKSVAASTTAHSIDVEIYNGATKLGAGDNWSVGDRIKLIFKINDIDGDTDSNTAFFTGNTIKFTYKDSTAATPTWAAYSTATPRLGTATDDGVDLATGGYHVAEWTIPAGALNADKIAYIIQPITEFGDPNKNDWLSVDDITKTVAPGGGGGTTPPTTPPGGGSGGGTTGGGSTGPVQPGNTYGIRIVYVDTAGAAVAAYAGQYQAANGSVAAGGQTRNPGVTDTYEAQVWNTPSGGTATDVTGSFTKFQWYLTGGNVAAKGTAATTKFTDVTHSYQIVNATSKTYKIDVNSNYATAAQLVAASAVVNKEINSAATAASDAITATNIPEAGAQGFKLAVIVKP